MRFTIVVLLVVIALVAAAGNETETAAELAARQDCGDDGSMTGSTGATSGNARLGNSDDSGDSASPYGGGGAALADSTTTTPTASSPSTTSSADANNAALAALNDASPATQTCVKGKTLSHVREDTQRYRLNTQVNRLAKRVVREAWIRRESLAF